MDRRLTTIVAADIAGFSRLIGLDEEGTLAAQRAHRSDLIDPLIARHGGRIANTAGDSLLIEFPSAVEAVRCAVAVQDGMAERNADVPEDQQIRFRIGINVGDVVPEGDDLLGDGVNIAARLEALAPPGGIVVSGTVHDQVRDRDKITLQDLGEVAVKNIARPVRAFQVLRDGERPTRVPNTRPRRPFAIAAAIAALALLVLVGGTWFLDLWPGKPPAIADADHGLPDKPSIAVLPFANMSDDPEQAYFADGMTEDLITDLAKISGLFVISRNSVFTYKGKAVKIRQVGAELGVRFVLEGSVRRFGNQLRITGQLIDATTGGHVWAENYDGSVDNVFAFQDEVRGKIVESLQVVLTPEEKAALKLVGTENVEAYEHYLKGMALLPIAAQFNIDPLLEARQHFERAIAADPRYGRAMAAQAWAVYLTAVYSNDEFSNAMRDSFAQARAALEIERTALAYVVLSKEHARPRAWSPGFGKGSDFARGVELLEQARALEPGNADVLAELAWVLVYAGDVGRARDLIEEARRRNPSNPVAYRIVAGMVRYFQGDYEAAARDFRFWMDAEPLSVSADGRLWLAAAHAMAGNTVAARRTLQPFLARYPHATTAPVKPVYAFAGPGMWEALEKGLNAAGLPSVTD